MYANQLSCSFCPDCQEKFQSCKYWFYYYL
jgi:hypothetical protein